MIISPYGTKSKGPFVQRKDFLSFLKARSIVRRMGFKNTNQYRVWNATTKPEGVPSNPNLTYRDRGWISFGNWLGTKNLYHQRKYSVNDNFFKTWSSNMAYVLGFWFADGCIAKHGRRYRFSISQNLRDKVLMRNILKVMGATYHLVPSRKLNSINILISSEEICSDILRLGGKMRKSLDVKWPKIPSRYLPDFVRGFFDGDGCIFQDKRGKGAFAIDIVCGSKNFIEGLEAAIRKSIPDIGKQPSKRGGFYVKKRKRRYWDLYMRGANIMKFGEYIYRGFKQDILAMPRKRDMFLIHKERINASNKRRHTF